MTIRSLGYLVFNTAHCEQWRQFGTDILGMEAVELQGDCVGLRLDEHAWRVALHPSLNEEVAAIGWQVADAAALDQAADVVAEFGISLEFHHDDKLCASRAVKALISFQDPSGQHVELFHTRDHGGTATLCGHGCGFITGELGAGHVFIVVENYQETCRLYERLGFRLSTHQAAHAIHFYHCNPREHSLALADATASIGLGKGFNHFMVELDDMDGVGLARDKCRSDNVPIEYELGRHTNDQMFSFYPRTPSGFAVEIGWGGLQIDEVTWEVSEIVTDSVWGHHKP